MAEAPAAPRLPDRLRLRARLLEFLKFRVLAAQDAFFSAFEAEADRQPEARREAPSPPRSAPQATGTGAELVPERLRAWLRQVWPEALALSDRELQQTFEQARRLYGD